MTTANVVFSGAADIVKPVQDEAVVASGETILPGMLLLKSSGEFIAHDEDGQGGPYRIADVNFIKQEGVTDAYDVGDTCYAFYPRPGEYYNCVLAASQTITKDEALTSNGAGALKSAAVDGTEEVLAYADEDLTTTGATGRLRVRIATASYNADTTGA